MDHEIVRSSRRTIAAQIIQGKLVIRAPLRMPEKEINKFIEKHRDWIQKHLEQAAQKQEKMDEVPKLSEEEIQRLMEEAARVIPERVRYFAPLVGVTYGRITIRCQKTRWGSCSSKGNLNFNCLLMLAPRDVMDSVVVHELCHRKEMNHSARFYDEVLRVFPEYWKHHGWLKEHGAELMAAVQI